MEIQKSLLVLCLSVSVLFCSSVFAFEKSHLEAAQELLEVVNFNKVLETMYETINTNLVESMIKEQACIESIKKPLIDLFTKYNKKILNPSAFAKSVQELYASEFTEQEIREIVAHYKTPAGKKALEKLPLLMNKSNKLAMELVEKADKNGIREELQKEMEKLMEKAGCEKPKLEEKNK